MSKLIVTSLIVCFGFMNLMAGIVTPFSVTADDNNYITLNIGKAQQEDIKVNLRDQYGVNIFLEKIQSDKANVRKYDIKKLDNGVYTLEVEVDNAIIIQKIKKSHASVEVIEEGKVSQYKPVIKNNDGMVSVNMLCFHGDFDIKVIDSKGNLVYNKNYEANGSFSNKYDLSTLPAGEYSFKIDLDLENYQGSFGENINVESGVASL